MSVLALFFFSHYSKNCGVSHVCRPHAECGPGAGETVPGGEEGGSGGAEGDVRTRAGVATATAVSGENTATPPQQQRAPHVPDAHTTRQAAAVDRGAVSGMYSHTL